MKAIGKLLVSVAVLFSTGEFIVAAVEPPNIQVCHINDSNRDECIKNSIQNVIPTVKNGSSGFPIADPYVYDSLSVTHQSRLLKGNFVIKDVKSYGIAKGKVVKVKSEFKDDEMRVQISMAFPKFASVGRYKANLTTTSQLNLNSKGQFNVTLRNIRSKIDIKAKLEKINGEDHMKVYWFDFEPSPESFRASITGLFPDENLNRIAVEYINQNWKAFNKEMVTEGKKSWNPIMMDLLNEFFLKYPFRMLVDQN